MAFKKLKKMKFVLFNNFSCTYAFKTFFFLEKVDLYYQTFSTYLNKCKKGNEVHSCVHFGNERMCGFNRTNLTVFQV